MTRIRPIALANCSSQIAQSQIAMLPSTPSADNQPNPVEDAATPQDSVWPTPATTQSPNPQADPLISEQPINPPANHSPTNHPPASKQANPVQPPVQSSATEPPQTKPSKEVRADTLKLNTPKPSTPKSNTPKLNTLKPNTFKAVPKAPALADSPWEASGETQKWRQGSTIKVTITDLSSGGDGVGRWEDRVVFVPNTVPGDEMRVTLTKAKATHGFGKPAGIVTASPQRVRPACIVADKCGGCQWQQVAYAAQLEAKHKLVTDALTRIGKLENIDVAPVLAADETLGYRNKATYPVGKSQTNAVKAGYYRKGSHNLVNLNQCPVQDNRLDPLLAEIKKDIQSREWKIYDERKHKGHIKHLSLRIGKRTGKILITLVSRSVKLKGIHEQAQEWMDRYPDVVGVLINLNWKKTNAIFGPETFSIAGEPHLEETFAGLTYHIQPATFFQVNTTQAERLLQHIQQALSLTGSEVLVDAYCGVGTFTLPLAQHVKQCIGLESFTESVVQAQANAALNNIENVGFRIGDVATLLPNLDVTPDILLLDPPRKGCEPDVIESIAKIKPKRIVYVSCNPATLARDLKLLCEIGGYQLTHVQPADFFPQTSHVECAAFLVA
ncbi:MAG: 23S rRNA (uracil(1939)-C(5))-methyltransferase RlmD [Cyanobacteria bacterium J06643_4]